MKKIVCVLLIMFSATLLISQERKMSMCNEISLDATIGHYSVGVPTVLVSYTGGINVSEHFAAGISLGYDPIMSCLLPALKVKFMIPKEKINLYASAHGGVRTNFDDTFFSTAVSAGIGIKFKKNAKKSINIGPVLEYMNEFYDEDSWGNFFGIKLGYQF